MASEESNLTGLQKAAVLLISLGPEMSATVFKHLKEEEIEDLKEYMQTNEYIRQVAKNVLGLVEDGDIVFRESQQ